MKIEEKIKKLKALSEGDLRVKLLVPLLRSAGFSEVRDNHGPLERGKDILFTEIGRLGEKLKAAAVVCVHDINGEVGNDNSAQRALYQAQLALDEPYKEVSTGNPIYIDRCWIITSGSISAHAVESISGKLQQPLGRLIRFIDGSRLIELIDEHYPMFWERDPDSIYIARSENIDISTNSLDPPYDREMDSLPLYGSLTSAIHDLKKDLVKCLYGLDEPRDLITDILRSHHPWEIIELCEALEAHINMHRQFVVEASAVKGFASEFSHDVEAYEEHFDIKPEERNIPKPWWQT